MDNQALKNILEKEIKKHYSKEMLYKKSEEKYKSHKLKRLKHMHKRHKTIDIAEKLGFTSCECCGGIK